MVDHLLDCQLGHEVGGFQIQVDGTVEGSHICFQEGGLTAPAGVVDENVGSAPGVAHGVGQTLQVAVGGEVCGDKQRRNGTLKFVCNLHKTLVKETTSGLT